MIKPVEPIIPIFKDKKKLQREPYKPKKPVIETRRQHFKDSLVKALHKGENVHM